MLVLARIVLALASAALVVEVVGSAIGTVVLPRANGGRLNRLVFVAISSVLELALGRAPSYDRRDAVYAVLGPLYLLGLVGTWLLIVWVAFAGLFWAAGAAANASSFATSASSLTTLGIVSPPGIGGAMLAGAEGVTGLVLVALLISYLPALYGAFSRREAHVNKLSRRAGMPPSGVTLLGWTWGFDRFEDLRTVWRDWENAFTDILESHTSFPVLAFFRSQNAGQSWITATGAVLDGASLLASCADVPREVDAELCIQAGYVALRGIAATLDVPFAIDPSPGDPITVVREEFDDACAVLRRYGVPLRPDLDAAWRDFRGWRVNYDAVLVQLSTILMAPYAPWSSDRSISAMRRPRLKLLRRRHAPPTLLGTPR